MNIQDGDIVDTYHTGTKEMAIGEFFSNCEAWNLFYDTTDLDNKNQMKAIKLESINKIFINESGDKYTLKMSSKELNVETSTLYRSPEDAVFDFNVMMRNSKV